MTVSIEEVGQFLASFRKFETETADARLSEFRPHFERLKSGVLELERAEAVRRRHEPAFNIFRLLGVERKEVSTHSVLLAELLKPDGSHGQGGLFLKSFLHRLGYPDVAAKISEEPGRRGEWFIQREADHIDISICSPAHGFLVFIENKIDAGEQDKQIERYRLILENQPHLYNKHCLVFLTLDGRSPTKPGRADICLSYRKDIVAWLRGSLPSVEAPLIRFLLEQYLDTIQNL